MQSKKFLKAFGILLKFSDIKTLRLFSRTGIDRMKTHRREGERINQHFLNYVSRYLASINYFQPNERIHQKLNNEFPSGKAKFNESSHFHPLKEKSR